MHGTESSAASVLSIMQSTTMDGMAGQLEAWGCAQPSVRPPPSKLFVLGYLLLAVGVRALGQGALPDRGLNVWTHREVLGLRMQTSG
jgi:hypothetical protein